MKPHRMMALATSIAAGHHSMGLINVFTRARRIIASLDRYAVFRWLDWLTRNRNMSRPTPIFDRRPRQLARVPVVPGDEFPSALDREPPTFREDVVTQNQLTLITWCDPARSIASGPCWRPSTPTRSGSSPPGSLIGISTIHFVRWVLIDEGRRLVMLSDYDGSWEGYIDEFAEMILSGLDAIWETSFGYPAGWRAGPAGLQTVPALAPGSLGSVLQRVPGRDGAQHRDDRTFARAARAPQAVAACAPSDLTDGRQFGLPTTSAPTSRAHHQRLRTPVPRGLPLHRSRRAPARSWLGAILRPSLPRGRGHYVSNGRR